MTNADLRHRLEFIEKAGRLKDTSRSAHTSAGKVESVAEHTWRLTLLAITFADYFPEQDLLTILKICILHDLGEAIAGDIPAPQQATAKAADERKDFISLLSTLPEHLQSQFISLWDDYEAAGSPEAKLCKALDKIETLIQHNQGKNPQNFDYRFNLNYGRRYTDATDLTRQLRGLLDVETQRHADQQSASLANLHTVEIKAFIPTTEYALCKQFYQDLGFRLASDGGGIAYFSIEHCSFLLQQVTPDHMHAQMMHLLVENIEDWYQQIKQKQLHKHYGTDVSTLITQPWGMREFILKDPTGTIWRIAQNV